MFTGMIEQLGKVCSLQVSGDAGRLTVTGDFPAGGVAIGDSIAVNGVCLTVVSLEGGRYEFDASPETIGCTTLKNLRPGSSVNLERALRVGDRLGGHIVTGHVDCVAQITERREISGNIRFGFRMPAEHARFVVEKGSITIDGISLTVNTVTGSLFTVNVIPHTASVTTLPGRRPGDEVNIETDILAKYVARLMNSGQGEIREGGLSFETLARNGFL
jgi:riboflavin synthase